MGSGPAIKVNLRLRHPSISASQLIEQIALKPSVARDRGTKQVTVGGVPRTNTMTYCSFPLGIVSVEAVSEVFSESLRIIERAEAFWSEFLATGGSIDYFVGIFVVSNVGLTLDSDVLARMGRWKIDLGLDVYARERNVVESQEAEGR